MDYTKIDKPGLRNLVDNARRLGREDVATAALQELTRQGGGRSSDYDLLQWNQATAKKVLEPFAEVARTVPDNRRTSYTEAGGMKIGRRRDDPQWKWVDSYSAIKTAKLNAVFVCYIPRPGDDAHFHLIMNKAVERRYQPAELDEALERWRQLAGDAVR